MRRIGWMIVMALLGATGPAVADDDWCTDPTLTGDWGGLRTTLVKQGICLQSGEVATFQANAGGVPHSNHRTAFASQFDFSSEIDFGRLIGLQGFLIHAEFWWQAGNDLSARDIGNLFVVSPAYGPNGVFLGQLYAQQTLLDGALVLQLGRLATNTTFAVLPVFNDYLNTAVNSDPANIPLNTPAFTSTPSVEWGAAVTYNPIDQIQLAAGLYNTDPDSAAPKASAHGTNFSLQPGKGVLAVGQVTYTVKGDKPGTYSLGGFYASDDYVDLGNGRQKSGNYGFYAMAQQTVSAGLTPWAAIAWQPRDSINLMPFFIAAGVTWQGLIPDRPDDTAAFMVAYGRISDTQPHTTGETVVELDYTIAAIPGLAITPDFQYIFNPSGGSGANNAAVFGVQAALTF